uniref:Pyrin domain-containing protein n=1 Tax=Lates calcarifer TaxID=8187 RepID=A0A4W6DH50_LATCA
MMTSQVLFDTLGHLGKDEFHNFKWHLQQGDGYSYSAIPKGKLEDAERRDTVDLMMQTYTPRKAVVVTRRILEKINRNDLELLRCFPVTADGDRQTQQSSKLELERLICEWTGMRLLIDYIFLDLG